MNSEKEEHEKKEKHEQIMSSTPLNTSHIPLCLRAEYKKTYASHSDDGYDYDPYNPDPVTKIKYKSLPDFLTKDMVDRDGTISLGNYESSLLHEIFPSTREKKNYSYCVKWELDSIQVVVDIHQL